MPEIPDTCKFCGATGFQDPDIDPCPHVCPRCMNQRVAIVMAQACVLEDDLDGATLRAWLTNKLVEYVGLLEPWAAAFVNGDYSLVDQAQLAYISRYGVDSPA
jgi:hypothetical protein